MKQTGTRTRKVKQQLEILQRISQLIGANEKVEVALQAGLDQLVTGLGYETAQIYRLSATGREVWLYLEASRGGKAALVGRDIFAVEEENTINLAIRRGEVVHGAEPGGEVEQASLSSELEFDAKRESSPQLPTPTQNLSWAEVVAPLRYGQVSLGVLRVQSGQRDGFDQGEIDFLVSLAGLLAATIRNSQTVRQLQDDLEEMKILYNLQRQEDEGRRWQAGGKKGLPGYKYERSGIAPVTELPSSAKLAMAREQVGVSTVRGEESQELVAPIKLYGETIGVLGVEGSMAERETWSTDDISLLEEVSSQVALAIENSRLLQQTQERTKELGILFEASRQLSETINLQQIYEIFTTQIMNYLQAEQCRVLLMNKVRSYFEVILSKRRNEQGEIREVNGTRVELIEDSASLQQLLRQPEVMIEHREAGGAHVWDPAGGLAPVQTVVSFPLFVRNRLIGMMQVGHVERRDYSQNEMQLAQAIISQATVATENAQLFQQTQTALAETQKLYEISRSLAETTQLPDVFGVVIENVKAYDIDQVSILVVERGQTGRIEAVTVVANWDGGPEERLPVGSRISAEVFSLAHVFNQPPFKPLIAEDLSRLVGQDERVDEAFRVFMRESLGAVTVFAAPMLLGAEYKGILTILTRKPHSYTKQEVRIYQTLTDQAIIAIENHRLLETTSAALSETELLYRAARDFNNAQRVEELLLTLVENFTPAGEAESGIDHLAVALIPAVGPDGGPERLEVVTSWERERGLVSQPGLELRLADYSFIQQFSPTAPYEVYYRGLDAVTQANIDKQLGGLRSILCIPLNAGKDWLGVLLVGSRLDTFVFKLNTINQIFALAGQMAIVMQNLQLIGETQANLRHSEILTQLSQGLLVADTARAIYNLTLEAIAATRPDRGAAIFIYDQIEGSVDLELMALWDNPDGKWPAIGPGARFSTEDLGLGPLLRTGQTVVSGQATEDERFSEMLRQLLQIMQINTLVAVPIWLNKEVNGFILVGNHRAVAFPAKTIRLYEDIGRQMSGALENRHLFEEAQYRASLLQTAAEVSQAATGSLDLDSLLPQAVELIRERFGFYHVSIFLVDEYQKYAVVKASTGEIGRQMLAMQHKLEVGGKSVVGTATGTGKPRIARDVGKEAVYFDNPLLPETHSEMALPLIARGRVIGALDVQSTKRGAFNEGDITILQSMVNQLANAIGAARAFQEAREALAEVRKLHEYYLRGQWDSFLKEERLVSSYQLTPEGLMAVYDDRREGYPAESALGLSNDRREEGLEQVFETKQPVMIKRANGEDERERAALVAPLTLHDQVVIGTLELELAEQEQGWQEDNLRIVEAVTSQAAEAIEAVRLFEQTQSAREEAEALYEVGRALVATEDEQEMLHLVLREMLSILSLKQGGVLFFEKDKKFGKLRALFEEGQPAEPGLRIPIEGNPSYDQLIATKRPVVIEDVTTDPLVASVREINLARGVASLLLVPILINDEVIGALGADAVGQKHVFTEREINLASAMADQLSIMLQNRRLLEATQRHAVQLQASSDVGRVVTSILDQELMLDEAVELIKDRFDFYHVQIFLIDEAKEYAVLYKSTGEAGQKLLAMQYQVPVGSQSVIGQVTCQRKSMVALATTEGTARAGAGAGRKSKRDPAPGLEWQRHEFLPDTRAELAVPLQVGETLIGVLDVQSRMADAFTREDIATLENLATQLAIAIQNAQAFAEQQQTAERLKEIDKLKTQFLANMSHELRTPLNSIIGFSRVILKGIDGPLTELQKTDLTSIHNSGQHLLGLINNILDLSKIEAGKMELNLEEVEVEPIIKGVMATAIALVKDKRVRLVQEIAPELPVVWADPTRIRQIVLNLVSNACKFTEEGAVTIRAFANEERVTISVSDTGIGIPKDDLESVFEEFTQVDASTTRKVGGTGLGLPISRHFVEMHKGRIWVESMPGKGSTFSFYIPIKPGEEDEVIASEGVGEDKRDGNGKVIVAIDDDPGVITLYERFLKQQNYKVIGINHSRDVLPHVKAHAPSAILLDVLMPEKDGWSVLRSLKDDPATKNIPVIICSIVSDKNRGFSLGAADYLIKPIVENELVKALKHLDNQHKEQIKVVVVDDQADDILLIRRILEAQSNYEIIEADNGKEGLELVKQIHPDLVILDLTMPEVDGFTVVEALKNDERTRAIPIIIVSAKEVTPAEYQLLTGQVEVLLRKGIFTENELLEDVSRALQHIRKEEFEF